MEVDMSMIEIPSFLKESLEMEALKEGIDFKEYIYNILMEWVADIQDGIESEKRYEEFLNSKEKGISWEEIQERMDNQ